MPFASNHITAVSVYKEGPKFTGKPVEEGVDMCQHLSLTFKGKAVRVKATVRTEFGKTDRPGSQGGLGKREIWRN